MRQWRGNLACHPEPVEGHFPLLKGGFSWFAAGCFFFPITQLLIPSYSRAVALPEA
jgi:hypothetical protein